MSRVTTLIPKRIASIRFGLMDPNEIRKMSSVEVKTADTYKDDGHAYRQGLMDPHMGVIEPGLICPTDNCKYDESPGHFGHIQLELPVIHIGFVGLIKTALKATCNSCSKILLHDEPNTHPSNPELSEQDYYRTRVRDIILKHGVGSTEFSKIIKEIEKVTSGAKRKVCMHCGAAQGKITLDKPTTFKEKLETQGTGKETERKLNPRDVREWLSSIPVEHLIFIGMHSQNRPEWTVLKVLPVPPITVRPSITLDSGDRSEDDLTHKLVDVLRINQRLRENRDSGAPQLIVEDLWELLQYHVTTYFDNQTSGIPPARHRSGRTLKTLTQRLKGKEGRFRSNLSGKRVNFCARSVISPDPYLGVNEVGVPEKIARELTVPIRVTMRNREQMRQMILRGPDVHPGVNYIIRGDKRRVRINARSRLINAGFRCHNPECTEETTMRPDLHQVMPAPNFLPGLVIKKEISRSVVDPSIEVTNYVADDDATLANLRGEDLNGNALEKDDPRAIMHYKWMWELEQLDKVNPDPLPEHLEITCPHCGSPSDEWGERTSVEDRLSTFDRDGNPKPGMQVERHLIDGDVAIFNRQPSLHRMSMMVHEVRVMQGHTFRFNLAVCTPYNADFDGDEMNLHVIQSEEARAEAKILMRVQEHILTPRYGGAVIGGIHDHISGAYLLSRPGTLIRVEYGLEMLGNIGWTGSLPEVVKDENGRDCFRGQDIISLIIPDNIHLRFRSRSKDDVVVKDGSVEGTLDKRAIGAEDGRLLDAIVQTNGPEKGAKFLDEFTQLSIAACTALGFTTGIDDEDVPTETLDMIDSTNNNVKGYVENAFQRLNGTEFNNDLTCANPACGAHEDFDINPTIKELDKLSDKLKGINATLAKLKKEDKSETPAFKKKKAEQEKLEVEMRPYQNAKNHYDTSRHTPVVNGEFKTPFILVNDTISPGDDELGLQDTFTGRIGNKCSLCKPKTGKLIKHSGFGEVRKGSKYEARPGRSVQETFEEDVMVMLDKGKQRAGDLAKDALLETGSTNAAVSMALSGARGSLDNLNMMAGSIGQAKVRGKRLERGYNDRVLAHFKHGSRGALERGFIANSFKRGLEPTEFFMLSVSGRESLVDTAVRTAKSGYMQRRLINAMDDLKVYDDEMLSVRNTANRIIQFSYGDDGIDPSRGVHGSPFNIDVIVDEALGTEGATVVERQSRDRDESEEDMGAWEFEESDSDGGEN